MNIFCKIWLCHSGIDGEPSIRGCDTVPTINDKASQPSIPEELNLHGAVLFFWKKGAGSKCGWLLFRRALSGCDNGCSKDVSAEVYLAGLLNCHHLLVAVGVCDDFQESSELYCTNGNSVCKLNLFIFQETRLYTLAQNPAVRFIKVFFNLLAPGLFFF